MAPRKKEAETKAVEAVETAEAVETTETEETVAPEAVEEETAEPVEDVITENPAESPDDEGKAESAAEDSVLKMPAQIEESSITEADASDFEKEMNLGNEFLRRSIVLPGRRRRREVFREDEEIIGDDNNELETYKSMRRKEYEILADAAKSQKPKVLYGRMIGTEVMKIGNVQTVMAVCNLIATDPSHINTEKEIRSSIFKIKIPAPLCFFDTNDRYSGDDNFDDLKRNMDVRVGSITEFVVYSVNMDDDDVLASRVNAMEILSYDNYLGKRARIKPGSLVKGRIVYINSLGVSVDVMGADVFIRRQDMSWRYIPDILTEKEFKVGKAVLVRVTGVETAKMQIYGRDYPYVRIKASIKDAIKNPNQQYFDKYELGQKYAGRIAYHLSTGSYIVNLGELGTGVNGEQPICICKAPSVPMGGVPYVGQRCSVAITEKNENTFQFFGAFTYMERN